MRKGQLCFLLDRLELSLTEFNSNMADGQLFKPEKDYTKEVDKQLPEAQELAKVSCFITGLRSSLTMII